MKKILGEAKRFHSHLGPFLVIGVKMGLLALHKLNVERGDRRLQSTVNLTYQLPISCLLDGIQFTSSCTFGNRRLKIKRSKEISATFKVKNGNSFRAKLNPSVFKELKNKVIGKNLPEKEIERLAYSISSMSDDELFIMQ